MGILLGESEDLVGFHVLFLDWIIGNHQI
jgi:hypothetical protein